MRLFRAVAIAVVCGSLATPIGCRSERRPGTGLDTGGDQDTGTGTGSDTTSDIDTSWSAPPHPLEVEWIRCFEAPDAGVDGQAGDLVVLGDGRIAVAGEFAGTEPGRFLTVLQADGATSWTTAAVTAGADASWVAGYAVDEAPDGDLLVAGRFQGEITFGTGESTVTLVWDGSDSDIFVARYADDGAFQWATSFSGEEMMTVGGLSSTPDGSAVIAGRMFQNATFDPGGSDETVLPGDDAGYLARFHPDGRFKAAVGTPDGSRPGSLVAWPDGRVFLGGCFKGSGSIWGEGEPTETVMDAQGYWDVFLAGYSAKGLLGWATSVRGGYDQDWEMVFDMAAIDDGTFVAAGIYTFAATFGEGEPGETFVSNGGMANGFLARYRIDGSLVWARGFGGDWDDQARAVATDGASVWVTGKAGWPKAVFGAGEPNQTVLSANGPPEDWDRLFVAKYGPDGDLEWAGGAPGSGAVLPRGIALAADGFVVGGSYEGEAVFGQDEGGGWVTCATENQKPFVVKYRP